MAAILRLTKLKAEEPIRVNFDNVAYYYGKGAHTVIVFPAPKYYEHTLTVKESLEQVDRLLGI
ncbi:hypothetical protein [Parapedobacter koreensis]|uniref:Uncharacterized protein n=1 Tax=Parapedobacter koreensis TaxID=332977 RepID=A0A1H7PXL9_9SPHI|nr:hypothetical protein [Parapedobacter koreensis]SEL40590.1 hypothetical protein SAMN05421740_10570 [Parapedobacter koreensis]